MVISSPFIKISNASYSFLLKFCDTTLEEACCKFRISREHGAWEALVHEAVVAFQLSQGELGDKGIWWQRLVLWKSGTQSSSQLNQICNSKERMLNDLAKHQVDSWRQLRIKNILIEYFVTTAMAYSSLVPHNVLRTKAMWLTARRFTHVAVRKERRKLAILQC